MDELKPFLSRMKKLNINIELAGNYPWIYLGKVTYPQPERHVGFDYDSDVLVIAQGYKIQ